MYDDILNGSVNNKNRDEINFNELFKDWDHIKEIKNMKYNSKDVIGVVITDENIEENELYEIKKKITTDTEYKEDEIVFVIGNILIEI